MARAIEYQRWDVFTDRALSGNQLAVILDGDAVEPELMQRIANEFLLPETVFICAAEAAGTLYRLRIFTPQRELPMAGHPTVGAAFALARSAMVSSDTPRIVLELGIGPTAIDLDWDADGLSVAWMSQGSPQLGPTCADVDLLGDMLGLDASDLLGEEMPAQVLSSGLEQLFVPLRSRAAVDRATLDQGVLARLCATLGVAQCPVYIFAMEPRQDATTYSRMFAPMFGIAEDPATGSANGPLGMLVARYRPDLIPESGRFVNAQGVRMGRPSRIQIAVADAGLKVGGQAVCIGTGTLLLD